MKIRYYLRLLFLFLCVFGIQGTVFAQEESDDDWGDDWGDDDFWEDYDDAYELDEYTGYGEDLSGGDGNGDDDVDDDWDDNPWDDVFEGEYDDDNGDEGDGGGGSSGGSGNGSDNGGGNGDDNENSGGHQRLSENANSFRENNYPDQFYIPAIVVPIIPVELVLTTATIAPIEVIISGGVSPTQLAAAVAAYNAANPNSTVQTSAVATENLAKFETNTPLGPAVEDFNRWLQEYIIDNIDPADEFMEIVRFEDKDCLSDDECKCTTEVDCGMKKWYLDRDGDGYHAKGSEPKEQVESPGEDWVEGVSDGEDCDDYDADVYEKNSCGECEKERTTECDECNTSLADLKKVFPTTSDDKLKKIAEAINENAKKFGIDTKEKLQHFLAQAGHESNNFKSFKENLNYRLAKLGVSQWKKYFNPQSNPDKDPDKEDPNDYKKSPTSTSPFVDNEKFANHVYGGRMGNNTTGDGYKYRGRGVIQLTGKNNYQSFTTYYQNNIDSTKNFINTPDLLASDLKIAVISAMWFYKNSVIDKLTINNNTSVESVTKKVNGGDHGITDRKKKFNKAKDNIDCQ